MNETWLTFTDMVARGLLRGVRTRGTTPGGTELYAATDRHRVTAIRGSWNNTDLGASARCRSASEVWFQFNAAATVDRRDHHNGSSDERVAAGDCQNWSQNPDRSPHDCHIRRFRHRGNASIARWGLVRRSV